MKKWWRELRFLGYLLKNSNTKMHGKVTIWSHQDKRREKMTLSPLNQMKTVNHSRLGSHVLLLFWVPNPTLALMQYSYIDISMLIRRKRKFEKQVLINFNCRHRLIFWIYKLYFPINYFDNIFFEDIFDNIYRNISIRIWCLPKVSTGPVPFLFF